MYLKLQESMSVDFDVEIGCLQQHNLHYGNCLIMQNSCEWFTAMIAYEEQLRECNIFQKCNSCS